MKSRIKRIRIAEAPGGDGLGKDDEGLLHIEGRRLSWVELREELLPCLGTLEVAGERGGGDSANFALHQTRVGCDVRGDDGLSRAGLKKRGRGLPQGVTAKHVARGR